MGTDLFRQMEIVVLRAVDAKNSSNGCNGLSAPHNPARPQQAGRICIE
jgi:hypothetical protein